MDRVRIEKAQEAGGEIGAIARRSAIDEPQLWAGISTVAGGTATGWHHHGSNTTVFYMPSGSLIVEHGPDSAESSIAEAGDFVVVPAGVPHREIVPERERVEAVVIRFGDGGGPLVVELDRD